MADDPRPPVWVGHVVLGVADLGKSKDYWTRLGLRFDDQLEPDLPQIEAEFKAEVAKYR